jgi:hypothetical protein
MRAGKRQSERSQISELEDSIRALTAALERLDARSERFAREIQGQLSTALAVLALVHDDDPGDRRRLRELRAGTSYEAAFIEPEPLVSVVVPTWNRVDTLIERAIPSILGQTYRHIEVIVVGDASPPAVPEAIASLHDSRIAFHNLTIRGPYEEDRFRAWLAAGTPGVNTGVARARGRWIAVLGDDDAFVPEHIERLLAYARERRLEFAYGQLRQNSPDGSVSILGAFPPRLGQIGLQAAIYHAGLSFMELELGHALLGKPNDWGLVQRMMRIGVRIGMIEEVSVDYWASGEHAPPAGVAGEQADDAGHRGA